MGGQRLGAALLTRTLPFAVIVALAVAHGQIVSPVYDFVSYFVGSFSRRTVFYDPLVLEHLPSLLITLLTLMVGGIPAAIYERVRGLKQTTPASLAIWLVTTLLITAPVFTQTLGLR